MISATDQAASVVRNLRRGVRRVPCVLLHASRCLADAAHQEVGDDVGKDHGDDPPGGGAADVLGDDGLFEDHVGQGGRGRSGPALGGGEDLAEDAQKEDRLDQDHHGDRAGHVRQDDVAKAADGRCAVHLGRLKLFGRQRLQRGQQDQRGKGQPFPGDDADDRGHRDSSQGTGWVAPQGPAPKAANRPFCGCMNRFSQIDAATGGITKKGAITRMRSTPWPLDRLVDQKRDQDAEDHRDDQNPADQGQRVEHGQPEIGRVEEPGVVGEARSSRSAPATAGGRSRNEKVPGVIASGHDHPDEQDDDRGRDHQAGGKAGGLRGHGRLR